MLQKTILPLSIKYYPLVYVVITHHRAVEPISVCQNKGGWFERALVKPYLTVLPHVILAPDMWVIYAETLTS